jgi:hypothetical protein
MLARLFVKRWTRFSNPRSTKSMSRPSIQIKPVNHSETGINFDSRTIGEPGVTQLDYLRGRLRLDIWKAKWSETDGFVGPDLRVAQAVA